MSIFKIKKTSVFLIVRMLICFVYSLTFSQNTKPIKNKLSNDFSYYIQKNNYPSQKALFCLVVKTGSINENKNQLGYAHFLEHMAFKGGKRFKNKQFTKFLEEQGMEIGTHFNAITNYNYTVYRISFPKKITSEIVRKVMVFFADILNGLHLDCQQIETEKKIVLEEKRTTPSPSKYYNFKLGNSLYLNRLAIGTDNSINNITQQKLNIFYKQWYQPKNSAVFIVGDIDSKKTKNIIKNIFTPIENNTSLNKETENQLYNFINTNCMVNKVTEKTLSKIYLDWAFKQVLTSPKQELVKTITKKLFNRILQRRLDSLLANDIKYPSIKSNYFLSDVSYSSISFEVKSSIKRSIEKILDEIQRLRLHLISEKELQFYVKQELYKLNKKRNQKKSSEQILNANINQYLGLKFNISEIKEKKLKQEALEEITVENIQEVAKQLQMSNKSLIFIEQSNENDRCLSLQEFKNIKARVRNKNLKAIVFDVPDKAEEKNNNSFKLLTPNIKPKQPSQKSYYHDLNITKLEYKNGIEIYLKEIRDSSNEIKISGISKGGTSSIPDSLYYHYEFTVPYMELGGISNLNSKELEAYHEGKNFGASFTISEFERNIFGHSKTNEINEFMKYLFLKMTKATADTLEFNAVIKDEIQALKEQNRILFKQNTYNKKVAELKNLYFPNRNITYSTKHYENLDIFRMQKFYDRAFNNAYDWKFVITGDFSTSTLIPILNFYLGNLNKNSKLKNVKLFDKSKFSNILRTPSSNNKKTVTTTFLLYNYFKPNLKNTILYYLTEKYLRNRIHKVLREKNGLVYTPIVTVEKSKSLKNFSILEIQYQNKATNTEKIKQIVVKSIEEILTKRLTEEELLWYKKSALINHNTILNSKDSHDWNTYIRQSLSNINNIEDQQNFKRELDSISSRDVYSFINKIINFKDIKIVHDK